MRIFRKSGWRLFPAAALALALAAGAWASPPKPPTARLRGEVIRFDAAAITVRSPKDPRIIHTFTYGPALRKKVDKLLETGGYHYGDRVKIIYRPGTRVAVAIQGKPSRRARKPRKRE